MLFFLFLVSNRNRSPSLIPYPNYEMNRLPDRKKQSTTRIIHAARMSVDECDRLWVIDMRTANGTSHGEPQLIVIDLKTDKVVRQFTIGSNLRRNDGETWFVGVIADVDRKSCDRAFAYLPDIRWGLVVYNFKDNTAWRLEHHYFYFDPVSTVLRISGVRLEWTDGVFGLALSERHSDGYRTLYFHALASTRMFSVDTRVLQSNSSVTDTFDDYHGRGHRPPGMQAAAMSMDLTSGAVFYALINRDAVGCWNPRRFEWHSIDTTAVVAQNSVTLQYPSDLKVDSNSNLWVLSNKMPQFRFRVHDLNFTNINYRVFSSPVSELIKGTLCELTEPYTGNSGNYSYENQGGSINNFPRLTTTRSRQPANQQSKTG